VTRYGFFNNSGQEKRSNEENSWLLFYGENYDASTYYPAWKCILVDERLAGVMPYSNDQRIVVSWRRQLGCINGSPVAYWSW
jgi:hypothetical protein